MFAEFDQKVVDFYTEQDQALGGIQTTNIFGHERLIDFVSISGGAISSTNDAFPSFKIHVEKAEEIKLQHQA